MITNFFTQSITIQRATTTTNDFGGATETWTDNSTINGYIDYLSGSKIKIADKYADKATHVLMCATGTDVTISDRVTLNGEIYRVLHPDTVFSNHMEVLLEYVGVDN